MTQPQPASEPERRRWQAVFDGGDETAYRTLVEPYMDRLIEAARRKMHFYVLQGLLRPDDLTPEEVVGETLIGAWTHRSRRPERMSFRGWMLGNLYRTLRLMVHQVSSYRRDKALSLDEPMPPGEDVQATEEQFWEWYQPDAANLWEDVVPGQTPVDYELPLEGNPRDVGPHQDAFHVMMLHDEFEMPIEEVAYTMNRSLEETAALLQEARVNLRDFLPPAAETDEPRGADDSRA